MGILDSISGWFKKEATEVKSSVDNLEQRLDTDLSRKEREMAASPESRLEMIQEEIDDTDSFSAIQDKIDATQGKALADADLAEADAELQSPDPDIG